MPMAYDSLIGDMGSSLSGGQRQRVLLARALYRRPKLLFMDEGTSHLDTEVEERVNAAIRGLGLTRIIIAHRPETIASASRRITIVDGCLHEMAHPDLSSQRSAICNVTYATEVDPADAIA
jgi:ATP-binding cassette subfamily B protein RaxB